MTQHAHAAAFALLTLGAAACAAHTAPIESASWANAVSASAVATTQAPVASRADRTPKPPPVRKALFARIRQDNGPATVRDLRPVHLAAGNSTLTFQALPADFDVHGFGVRPVQASATAPFRVLETRVQGTSPSVQRLLATSVGKAVRVRSGEEHPTWDEGTLVAVSSDTALVSVGGAVLGVPFNHVAFVDAPAEPVLEAAVQASGGDTDVELTYATSLLHSTVTYSLVRTAGTARGVLRGAASLTNGSGADLPNATVTLSSEVPSLKDFTQGGAPAKTTSPAEGDTALIRFAAPISLPAGRSVSEPLFGPSEVTLTRRVVIEGLGLPVYSGTEAGETSNSSVRAVVDANAVLPGKLSPLGMLPGSTELFEADAQASDPPRKYDDTYARPLPGGIGLRIDLGDERGFDTRRRLLGTRNLGRCVSESTWEVSVTNPTEEPIPFEDVEPVSGDYVVVESSLPATAKERDYFGFEFPVAGKATVKLRFRARVTSCVETRNRGYWYGGLGKSGKPSPFGS
jgi:hypothetical protein